MKKAKKDMIVYRGASVPSMDVMVDGETVWLSIDQMAELFGRDPSVIGKHVRNVFSEEERVFGKIVHGDFSLGRLSA